MIKSYDYVVIGAGIAGCSTAYFLSKKSSSVLLIDRNCDLAQGASGAAGAFLSPLLGKPNPFKDLVTSSLNFSIDFYLKNMEESIENCGVLRIPKSKEDRDKFESYKSYMDFSYEPMDDGYFFKIGSQVKPYEVCSFLAKDVEKLFKYEVDSIKKDEEYWLLNGEIRAKRLILATGADISLIDEKYFNIRAVWGQKIDILTTTKSKINYHKECSLSHTTFDEASQKYFCSVGATHHRVKEDLRLCNHCINSFNGEFTYDKNRVHEDNVKLLNLANDIKRLDDVEIIDIKVGPRASSLDYFPMVGKLINSKKTLKEHPHLINGSHIKSEMFSRFDNLYVLNGVGGRGFVLSPYLAKNLVELIINNKELQDDIKTDRLFKRWAKRVKN